MKQEVCIRVAQRKSSAERIRVWVVAGQRLVLESLSSFISKNRQFALAGALSFDFDRLKPPKTTKTDIVVVYLEPGDPTHIVKDLRLSFPYVRIIAVTDGRDLDFSVNILKFGAVGIVQSTQGPGSLTEAIKRTYNGETWLNQDLLINLLEKDVTSKRSNGKNGRNGNFGPTNDSLTPREIEVISMIGQGLKSKVIAERLSISGATVRHHLSSIYGKLGVDDRLNLVIYAIEKGLVKLGSDPVDGQIATHFRFRGRAEAAPELP